jgi:hypothetical protein
VAGSPDHHLLSETTMTTSARWIAFSFLFITSGIEPAALSAQSAAASPKIDGTWTGEATAPAAPPFPVTMELKRSGRTVSGTVSFDEGPPAPITEGTIEGDAIFFWFSAFGGDVPCEGRVSASEIRLKAPTEIGITFDIVLTRKK